MTILELVEIAAALWWGGGVLLLLASFIAALLFPHLPWQGPGREPLRPVTAIVPIKASHDSFREDQASLFAQEYPQFEILVTAAEMQSEALSAIRDVRRRFPDVASHVVQSGVRHAASPKLNNLWPAIGAARHDLILTKDCNIRLAPGDLENLVHHHGPGVGLVSTISITTDPESFGAWIETSIINCYHARMLMLVSALGLGVGCGKIMLFSREALGRAGGLTSLAWAIGEDEAMQNAFAGIGLRTVLSDRISRQILGKRSLRAIWQRQLRWMLIWRMQTPGVFVGDFFASALPVSCAAALAAPLLGIASWAAMAATLGFWFATESLLCLIKGWPLSLWSLPAFFGREILGIAVHVRALTTRTIAWGGSRLRVDARGRAVSLALAVLDVVVFTSLIGVIIIGLGYLSLPLLFFLNPRQSRIVACPPDAQLPQLLIQLAVFNEPAMVTGLLQSVAALDWPRDRLHIQLLDDSFDSTTTIAAEVIAGLRAAGFSIDHRHRTERSGFKAGALAAGMAASNAPFIAIFDADFRPPANWLRSVMGYFFADPRAGFVQSRFEFSNWNANALTRMQGLLSDAHFVMEQDVRARAGLLFQFNGTAGVLRREAVLTSGGWSDDSLAEDLDLVVRMEIAGWHGVFVMQPGVPALAPETVRDWRVQQRRWALGFAQVARKLLAAITEADWSLPKKLSAIFLILYQGAFALVTVALIGLLLEGAARGGLPDFAKFLGGIILVLCAMVAIGTTLPPQLVLKRGGLMRYAATLVTLPPLLLYLSLANSLPMLAAFFGRRESFKRTPKA